MKASPLHNAVHEWATRLLLLLLLLFTLLEELHDGVPRPDEEDSLALVHTHRLTDPDLIV